MIMRFNSRWYYFISFSLLLSCSWRREKSQQTCWMTISKAGLTCMVFPHLVNPDPCAACTICSATYAKKECFDTCFRFRLSLSSRSVLSTSRSCLDFLEVAAFLGLASSLGFPSFPNDYASTVHSNFPSSYVRYFLVSLRDVRTVEEQAQSSSQRFHVSALLSIFSGPLHDDFLQGPSMTASRFMLTHSR
jgi:hypothetical protein